MVKAPLITSPAAPCGVLIRSQASLVTGVATSWAEASHPEMLEAINDPDVIKWQLEALRERIVVDPKGASNFIALELGRLDLAEDWRRIVIYAAEAVRFEDVDIREKVASSLVRQSIQLRGSTSPDDVPVVMCALRRAGSILPESAVIELAPLLATDPYPINTYLAALQAIASVFYLAPPSDKVDVQCLADRAVMLAKSHWDVHVFKAGEISAIAIESTVVASILGDARAIEVARLAKAVQKPHLIAKLRNRLEEVAERWKKIVMVDSLWRVQLIEKVVLELCD